MKLHRVLILVSQEFLTNDRIDFFFLGDFNEVEIQNVLESFGFKGRKGDVKVQYCQPYSNILQEGMVRKNVGQSILELGYHCLLNMVMSNIYP